MSSDRDSAGAQVIYADPVIIIHSNIINGIISG